MININFNIHAIIKFWLLNYIISGNLLIKRNRKVILFFLKYFMFCKTNTPTWKFEIF